MRYQENPLLEQRWNQVAFDTIPVCVGYSSRGCRPSVDSFGSGKEIQIDRQSLTLTLFETGDWS
jgi:hypothetical protein